MKKISLLLLIGLLSIGLLAACGNNDDGKGNNDDSTNANGEMDLPEPNLDDIPKVVAEVNGEEITKEDFEEIYTQQFQQQAMYAQMTGEEVNEDELKGQVVDSLVDQQVFFQEADKRFPEASQEGIDELFDDLIEQFEAKSKEDLLKTYKENGVDEDELMENIELQVRINQLIEEDIGEIKIKEDEIKEAYDAAVKEQEEANKDAEEPQEIPEFDEVKDMIENNLKEQKEAEALQVILDDLREKAEITVHI